MNFDEGFTVVNPGCGCARFAVPTHVYEAWRCKEKRWHCPHCGSCRFFSSTETPDQRRAREAEERLEQERERAHRAEQKASAIGRQYKRMKTRVKNGVCPCCTRTFENLARHMADMHPDFGAEKNLKTLRLLYGLTQAKLATDVGVPAPYVSAFENGREIPVWAKGKIMEWLGQEAS